ncbi:hypothetical protein AB1Y20_015247 [Prymnesium parvum]|uniref:Sugar phosphate transporter domain-containing protein n=1 Tax=Prymnesium parvum TaxID=97485 RepID=A0AB34K055_PRYPA
MSAEIRASGRALAHSAGKLMARRVEWQVFWRGSGLSDNLDTFFDINIGQCSRGDFPISTSTIGRATAWYSKLPPEMLEEEEPTRAPDEQVLLTPSHERQDAAREAAWQQLVSGAVTVLVCVAYTLVGPMLIMLNKIILTQSSFPYPILLTCFHQVASAVFAAILIRIMHVIPLQHGDMEWSFWRQHVLVVGFATTAALCTGNSAYMYLTVAFIEILKGFTPVVTMMVQTIFGEAMPRPAVALTVLCISVGTAISSFGEMKLSLPGLFLMLLSVYCEAMRLMLTQRMLQKLHFHVLEGLYFTAPASAIWMLLLAAVVEIPRLKVGPVWLAISQHWLLFVGASLLGFLVNVTSFLVIQRTNVVMLKLLAISRNAMVVFCGIVFFEESVSLIQAGGYLVSLLFFVIYNYLQLKDAGHCS